MANQIDTSNIEIEFFQKFISEPRSVITETRFGLCANYGGWIIERNAFNNGKPLQKFSCWLAANYGDSRYPICTAADYENLTIPKYSGEMLERRIVLAKRYLAYLLNATEQQKIQSWNPEN